MITYRVIDRLTGIPQSKRVYKSLRNANRAVDRLDNVYGGYKYRAERIAK